MNSDVDRPYIEAYKHAISDDPAYGRARPTVWGFHDYGDLVHERSHLEKDEGNIYLEEFLHDIGRQGEVWLSEQGVELREGSELETVLAKGQSSRVGGRIVQITPIQLEIEAADDFLALAPGQPRIELVDYYEYEGPAGHGFDSALKANKLVSESQTPRQAYCVLAEGKRHGCAEPYAATRAATSIASTGAMLNVVVTPRGLPTTELFEYGTTSAFGRSTTLTELANPEGEQTARAGISGLEPCTTYHYRIVAQNEASEGSQSLGEDKTFETECSPPTITLEPLEEEGNDTGTNVYVNPNGFATTVTGRYTLAPLEYESPARSDESVTFAEITASDTPEYVDQLRHVQCDYNHGPGEDTDWMYPPRSDPFEVIATSRDGTTTAVVSVEVEFCRPD